MVQFKKFKNQKYNNLVFSVKEQVKKYYGIALSKDEAKKFVEENIFLIINDEFIFATINDQKLLKEAKINNFPILKFKDSELLKAVTDGKSHYWVKLK